MTKEYENELRYLLKDSIFNNIHLYENVSSTMDKAKEYAFEKDYDRNVFIALSQRSGIGTNSRSFLSEEGGVYLSILFRNKTDSSSLFTMKGACAVCMAVKDICGIDCNVKWVNDVYYKDKKICGILTQSAYMGNDPAYTIMGIGLNVNQESFGDIPAESLYNITGKKYSISQVTAKLLTSFEKVLNKSDEEILKFYRNNCVNIGQKCVMVIDGKECVGKVTDIGKNGELMVKTGDETLSIRSRNEIIKFI